MAISDKPGATGTSITLIQVLLHAYHEKAKSITSRKEG